jgi:hypothetical protein
MSNKAMLGESSVQPFLRATAALAVAVRCVFAPPAKADSSTRALSDFLEGRIAPEVSEFGETQVTRKDVSAWMEKARTAPQPRDRGIAIANLQNCAWILLSVPEATPAAIELLDQWVMPYVILLRGLPRTSACSYENVLFGAYACYREAGDSRGEKRALELLATQAREPGLRDLAILRLASTRAGEGNLREAIEIARRTDSRGEFAKIRAKIMKAYQEELRSKKAP